MFIYIYVCILYVFICMGKKKSGIGERNIFFKWQNISVGCFPNETSFKVARLVLGREG